jgi:O-antigen/teichoic acid export membrane protein
MIKDLFTQYKHLIKEGSWVFFGQASVAIISLAGLRILTEIAPANLLGGATLLLGALSLLRNIFIAPIGNTQIRFHPEYVNTGNAKWFDDNIKKLYKRLIVISILVFIVIFFIWSHLSSYAFNLLLLLILIFYYTLDAIKSFKINRLSAERRQKYAAIWQTVDALLVNTFFIVALLLVNNVESYLTGQTIGLLIGLLIFGFITFPKIGDEKNEKPSYSEIKDKVIHYGLPFIPIAIVTWLSNLGDRYLIGNYLSLTEVGIYTAVYSIASRPIIMINGIINGLFRPILFQAKSIGDKIKYGRITKTWFTLNSIIFLVVTSVYLFAGNYIQKILLGKDYIPESSNIFLFIGIAYCLMGLIQITENIFYAEKSSSKTILPSLMAAISNIIFNIMLIPKLGILGAAVSSFLSFGLHFIIILVYLKSKS